MKTPHELLNTIDFKLLAEQKLFLLMNLSSPEDQAHVDGLISLIDGIEDCARDNDIAIPWRCTDPDAKQFGRQLSKTEYEFYEDGAQMIVNLIDFNDHDLRGYLASFYSDPELSEMLARSSDDDRWLMAECIFETDATPPLT